MRRERMWDGACVEVQAVLSCLEFLRSVVVLYARAGELLECGV